METVTYRSLALDRARQEIGVMEQGANNHGERVEFFQTFDSLPGEGYAWCNSFVDAMFELAGRPLVETYKSAGVELTLARAKALGWVVATPQPGDLVVFTFSHIGFVDEVHDGTHTITTIEGNTGSSGAVSDSSTGGDGVYRKVRSMSLVRAYIRVPGSVIRVNGRYPAAVLVTRKGYFSWLAWSLGEGDWKGYAARDPRVRPAVRKFIPLTWWAKRAAFIRNRKKGAK